MKTSIKEVANLLKKQETREYARGIFRRAAEEFCLKPNSMNEKEMHISMNFLLAAEGAVDAQQELVDSLNV